MKDCYSSPLFKNKPVYPPGGGARVKLSDSQLDVDIVAVRNNKERR